MEYFCKNFKSIYSLKFSRNGGIGGAYENNEIWRHQRWKAGKNASGIAIDYC
jgi:hypothetical protein